MDARDGERTGVAVEEEARGEAAEVTGFAGIIGRHPRMQAIFEVIRRVAPTGVTVLITGESGTGKELVAQAIHSQSRRHAQRLVPVHCGAIPEELLESEMFGHERGAFTGAVTSRVGRFKLADGGTIFLDEVGDMSTKLQVKLLRVLENGQFEPVGGVSTQQVDVRVVAATNRNLEEAVGDRQFREDLYYRLRVVPIEVPPLRARREDVPLLVDWFLNQMHTAKGLPRFEISPAAMEVLTAYQWPGNVRELKNLLEQLVVLGPTDGVIRPENLPPKLHGRMAGDGATSGWTTPPWDFDGRGIDFYREMESIEDRIIARALDISRGNKKEAARLLQLNRTTLLEKLKRKRESRTALGLGEGGERLGPMPIAVEPQGTPIGDFLGLAGGQALRA
ncbi:MAG: sigma-54-dependent Fis family transcriptional regulator [Deltaproteobacteria bacterium]|nr:sigma-54-dependent Fis family transcriptional regulator [Deltaproteobacteria bacterium]